MSYTCTKSISVTVVEAGKEEPNGVYRGIYVDVYPNEWIIWSDFIYQLSFVPSVFIYTCCLYMHYGWYNVWTIIWNHLFCYWHHIIQYLILWNRLYSHEKFQATFA